MPDHELPDSQNVHRFRWLPSLVGGMASIGGAALLGTLVTNVSLWVSLAKGLTLQEAYGQMGFNFSSPTELLSFGVVLISGSFGGYVSALYGSGRHLIQALAAGAVGTTFFVVMSLGPSNPPMPGWYVPLYLVSVLLSSLVGGYAFARRA